MTEIMRLQKYLSQAWICSRRKAEEYIKDGQVLVNGQVATLWMSVNPDKDSVVLW
jgi:23S rRNA pseudouridine2605 synthase